MRGIPEDARNGERPWPTNPFLPGHVSSIKHGAHSERLVGPLAADLAEAIEELVVDTPAAHPAFIAARGALARKLAQLQLVSAWLDSHEWIDKRGGIAPPASYEVKLLASIERSLDVLGLTPQSAARLGVDLVRGRTLAGELSEAQLARERADSRHG